jgi:hypothetical protein
MQIGYMRNAYGLPACGCFPLPLRFVLQNSFNIVIEISEAVLLWTEPQLVADCVRIGEMPPEGVDDGVDHLADCALADVVTLQVLFAAVGRADQGEDGFGGSSGHRMLELLHDLVAETADRIGCQNGRQQQEDSEYCQQQTSPHDNYK